MVERDVGVTAAARGGALREKALAASRQYHPPTTGLHVCAFMDDDGEHGPHLTLHDVPMSADAARAAFSGARAAWAVPFGDADLVVDLMVDGSQEDEFWMTRQMVDPMMRSLAAAVPS